MNEYLFTAVNRHLEQVRQQKKQERRAKLRRAASRITAIAATILIAALFLGAAPSAGTAAREYTDAEAEMLARTVWAESRGLDRQQQAAVVWCVLNRVDNPNFPNTVSAALTQPYQFAYSSRNPLDPDILALTYDVLERWSIEPMCVGSVGRVLPEEYLFFSGNGKVNTFRTNWRGGTVWDWTLENPY